MSRIRKADIERVIKQYVQESNGYTYLLTDNVKEAQDAIAREFDHVLAYVKESKFGFKRLYVDKVNTKSLTKLLDIVIRDN